MVGVHPPPGPVLEQPDLRTWTSPDQVPPKRGRELGQDPGLAQALGLRQVRSVCAVQPRPVHHHIISACQTALVSKRYTWRHDSVLLLIKNILSLFVDKRVSVNPKDASIAPLASSFVRTGSAPPSTKKPLHRQSLLDGASDWKLLVDFDDEKIVFPPEICPTSSDPILSFDRSKLSG